MWTLAATDTPIMMLMPPDAELTISTIAARETLKLTPSSASSLKRRNATTSEREAAVQLPTLTTQMLVTVARITQAPHSKTPIWTLPVPILPSPN